MSVQVRIVERDEAGRALRTRFIGNEVGGHVPDLFSISTLLSDTDFHKNFGEKEADFRLGVGQESLPSCWLS